MSDDEVTSAAARHDHLGASPSSVTSAGGAVQCISIVPTMEDDNDGQFIADAILFLSLDPPEVGPSAPPATAAFESRGPSLALLERLEVVQVLREARGHRRRLVVGHAVGVAGGLDDGRQRRQVSVVHRGEGVVLDLLVEAAREERVRGPAKP